MELKDLNNSRSPLKLPLSVEFHVCISVFMCKEMADEVVREGKGGRLLLENHSSLSNQQQE